MARSKFTAKLVLKAQPGNLKVSQQFLQAAGRIVVDDVIAGIKAQRQLDNAPLKPNAKSTKEAKRRAGMPPLSLIAEGQHLINRATYAIRTTARTMQVRLTGKWDRIAGYLFKLGYRGWMGLGPRAGGKIMKLYKEEMLRLLTGKK